MVYQSIRLPNYLREHSSEIHALLGKAQSRSFDDKQKNQWLRFFQDNSVIHDEIKYIFNKFNGRITRENLADLARETRNNSWPDIRRFYLATMMWGWGSRGRPAT